MSRRTSGRRAELRTASALIRGLGPFLRTEVDAALGELVEPPTRPEVVRVEQIPPTSGGKLRTIVAAG